MISLANYNGNFNIELLCSEIRDENDEIIDHKYDVMLNLENVYTIGDYTMASEFYAKLLMQDKFYSMKEYARKL